MRRLLALLALAAIPAAAQQIDDPANLMGERVSAPALADTLPINHGSAALEQLLRKLRTRASMMFIVAHPDDEDSGLLTLESRGMGARVAMLTLTRGEGGQNLMSADFNDALGLIRTQELLAEDRYTGVDQFFGTEVDFGFSKTKEEAFKKWTHDRVLYDAVRSVRLYRPLVLASTFIGGITDGHGQHQVSGEICQEVFQAAADPKVFPEMGLPPWAPLRVYARVPFSRINEQGMFDYATGKFQPPHFHNYVTGMDTTAPPVATVTIHEGDTPAIPAFHGFSYVQWARQGLALQKTQIGPGFRVPPAGPVDVGYTLMGCRSTSGIGCPILPDASPGKGGVSRDVATEEDLFTGIDTSLPSIADLAPAAPKTLRAELVLIDSKLAEAQKVFDPNHLETVAAPLSQALLVLDAQIKGTQTSRLPVDQKFNLLHELRIKRVQLNDALVLAEGLTLTATLADQPNGQPLLTTQHHFAVATSLSNRSSEPITLDTLGIVPTDSKSGYQLPHTHNNIPVAPAATRSDKVTSDFEPGLPATRPYFSRKDREQPFYDVSNPALRNAPSTPNSLVATARTRGTVELDLNATVQQPTTSSSPATTLQAAAVVPPVSIKLTTSAGIIAPRDPEFTLQLIAGPFNPKAFTPPVLKIPSGWSRTATPGDPLPPPGGIVEQVWHVTPGSIDPNKSYTLVAEESELGQTYTEGYRSVGYPGLTYTNFYTPATFKAVPVDVTTAPNLHIAYLPGTGDDVPAFLPSLGVTAAILTPRDLTPANLAHYDAILLGVRAYAAHPELKGTGSEALTAYAKAGGVVIVQYNSGDFTPSSAPFPYTLPGDSAHNVVEEEQPVHILQPENPLLTWPNRITSADFDHWIEERGHGFASEWAPQYTPLLEAHDVDQDPQRGGLLVATVGKGAYIYCAFALYRQLPEGVPGAYRLMANLLSYAKNPSR